MARVMRVLIVPAFLLAVVSVQARAQSSPVSFEVASIKPNTSSGAPITGGAGGPSIGIRGSLFVATNASLRDIIRYAYQLEPYQALERAPRWIDDRFDITAVVPEIARTADRHRVMLRTLLAERFKLSVRSTPNEQPLYALLLARRDGRLGPALKRSTTDCASAAARGTSAQDYRELGKPICDMVLLPFRVRLQGSARTMADLARLLSRVPALGAPVLDRTGLEGPFDFDLTYAPERPTDPARGPGEAPSLFVAIEEQLGLRLQRTRGTVDVLVIERLEPLARE